MESSCTSLGQKIELVCKNLPGSARKSLFPVIWRRCYEILADYIFLGGKKEHQHFAKDGNVQDCTIDVPALDTGNKSFIKFTALDIIQSRLSKLEKSDEQDPLHKWIGYYNHTIWSSLGSSLSGSMLHTYHRKKAITSCVYSFCLFLLCSRVVVIFKQ